MTDYSKKTKNEQELESFGTNLRFLFHILHFRCLHLNHIYHKQKKCPMVQINTLSVNSECGMFLYFVFICRIHICIQYTYFFFKGTYKQYQQMKIIFSPNKVHLYYSLKHVTLAETPLIWKRPESGRNSCIRLQLQLL